MKLTFEQFQTQLTKAPLAVCYWLSGDEHFLLEEARAALRETSQRQDYEYLCFDIAAGTEWSLIIAELQSRSLFSQKRFIELRLTTGKLAEAATDLLARYLDKVNPDTILLVTSPKLEQGVANSRCYKIIEDIGVVLPIWPLAANQLSTWLAERLRKQQLKISLEGLHWLIDMTEGNLPAAANEIAKLALLYPAGKEISLQELQEVLVSQARFDIYAFADVFLQGKLAKQIQILRVLQQEGVELTLILWVISKELRNLIKLQQAEQAGAIQAKQWLALGIFDKRKSFYLQALKRPNNFTARLGQLATIDQIVKGYVAGNPWLALEEWLMA